MLIIAVVLALEKSIAECPLCRTLPLSEIGKQASSYIFYYEAWQQIIVFIVKYYAIIMNCYLLFFISTFLQFLDVELLGIH